MRKLHPSYECFVKEHKPKYGEPFPLWYHNNYKIADVEILIAISQRTHDTVRHHSINRLQDDDRLLYTYHSDFFMKKLQLCKNLLALLFDDNDIQRYELGRAADVMDLYEDIIYEVCTRHNVGVCGLPSGFYKSKVLYVTAEHTFKDFEEFKDEMQSGEVVVYFFRVNDNNSITVRMAKREPLTRKVLTEKNRH